MEFQQKNANALYILLNQMKTGLESRERVRKLQKKKNKSKKSRAAADFGLDILTQMPIKQIKWDSKCVW